MSDSKLPDLSTFASPPRCDLQYSDFDLGDTLGSGGQTTVVEATVPDEYPIDRVALRQLGSEGQFLDRSVDREQLNEYLSQADKWMTVDQRERSEPRWNNTTPSEHVVGIIDTGENLPWIALEYMEGGSLADRLEANPNGLPVEEALWIGERLCHGVEVAHNNAVAHLDIKPGNILFRPTGPDTWDVPKLADWGLARGLFDESRSQELLSPKYAAPEQFIPDDFGRRGTATDIYQLGAVMMSMLTGEPPYTGSKREMMFGTVEKDLPLAPSKRRDELPTQVDSVVLTALEPQQANRYDSVAIFKRALNKVRAGESLSADGTSQADNKNTQQTVADDADGLGQVSATDLLEYKNRTVSLEGEITDIQETSGPTVFKVRDKTGIVECVAFDSVQSHEYQHVETGDIVRVIGEVEYRRDEVRLEIESLIKLS